MTTQPHPEGDRKGLHSTLHRSRPYKDYECARLRQCWLWMLPGGWPEWCIGLEQVEEEEKQSNTDYRVKYARLVQRKASSPQARGELTARVIAVMCNLRWKASPITWRDTPWDVLSLPGYYRYDLWSVEKISQELRFLIRKLNFLFDFGEGWISLENNQVQLLDVIVVVHTEKHLLIASTTIEKQ